MASRSALPGLRLSEILVRLPSCNCTIRSTTTSPSRARYDGAVLPSCGRGACHDAGVAGAASAGMSRLGAVFDPGRAAQPASRAASAIAASGKCRGQFIFLGSSLSGSRHGAACPHRPWPSRTSSAAPTTGRVPRRCPAAQAPAPRSRHRQSASAHRARRC